MSSKSPLDPKRSSPFMVESFAIGGGNLEVGDLAKYGITATPLPI